MGREKFDVDKFVDEISAEDDGFLIDEEPRYTECPKCGSDTWDKLFYGKNGLIKNCNECQDEHEQ